VAVIAWLSGDGSNEPGQSGQHSGKKLRVNSDVSADIYDNNAETNLLRLSLCNQRSLIGSIKRPIDGKGRSSTLLAARRRTEVVDISFGQAAVDSKNGGSTAQWASPICAPAYKQCRSYWG
jgi:hypothetical protein